METLKSTDYEKVAFVLKTIGHPVRLQIIEHLVQNKQLSVSQICEILNLEQSLVSHHLTKMKEKGILNCTQEGKNRYYYLALEEVLNVISCMQKCKL